MFVLKYGHGYNCLNGLNGQQHQFSVCLNLLRHAGCDPKPGRDPLAPAGSGGRGNLGYKEEGDMSLTVRMPNRAL